MTKTQALSYFKEYVMPAVVAKYGRNDRVALAEAWNDWTDSLCKNGEITAKQYDSWDNPF